MITVDAVFESLRLPFLRGPSVQHMSPRPERKRGYIFDENAVSKDDRAADLQRTAQ